MDPIYNPTYYENYANVTAEKTARRKGLTQMFRFTPEFVQVQSGIFLGFVQNIFEAEVSDRDTIETATASLESAEDTYGSFVMSMRGHTFGKNLTLAFDRKQYLRSKLEIMLQGRNINTVLIAQIAEIFNMYLKRIAKNMADFAWYSYGIVFSHCFALSMLRTLDMEQSMIDLLQENIRERPPRKPKLAKGAGAVTQAVTPADADTTATTTTSAATTITADAAATTATTTSADAAAIAKVSNDSAQATAQAPIPAIAQAIADCATATTKHFADTAPDMNEQVRNYLNMVNI
jgi:hypothetical protein